MSALFHGRELHNYGKRVRLVADCIQRIREVPGFKIAIVCHATTDIRAIQREFERQGGKDLLGSVRFIQTEKRINGKAYTTCALDDVRPGGSIA